MNHYYWQHKSNGKWIDGCLTADDIYEAFNSMRIIFPRGSGSLAVSSFTGIGLE